MSPLTWEGTGGTTTKVGALAYEDTAGSLTHAREVWYESPAGTLTQVFTTAFPRVSTVHSFTRLSNGEFYVMQDANPANYFDGDSRDLIRNQGWDPNAEGGDVVPEGLHRFSASGSNIGGGRMTGLLNRGPAAVIVMPNGELIWASAGGDLIEPNTTTFNRYSVNTSVNAASNPQRIDIYHDNPNRNDWHHRMPGNEQSHFDVRSGAVWSDNEVLLVISNRSAPLSTYRFSSPQTATISSQSIEGQELEWTRQIRVNGVLIDNPIIRTTWHELDFVRTDTIQTGTTVELLTETLEFDIINPEQHAGMRTGSLYAPGGITDTTSHDNTDAITRELFNPATGMFESIGGFESVMIFRGRTIYGTTNRVIALNQGTYRLNQVYTHYSHERVVKVNLDTRSFSGQWVARTQEGDYRLPQISGVTSDRNGRSWFCGNFSGIISGGLPRNGAGQWGIWDIQASGFSRQPDAFSPYGPNVWLQDLEYIDDNKILVLCETPEVSGRGNTNFVTVYNPTTQEWDDSEDFRFRF